MQCETLGDSHQNPLRAVGPDGRPPPGTPRSQLIKQVCRVAPRAVYTSGKGSSSVGLTAAVVKDPNTGEAAGGQRLSFQ